MALLSKLRRLLPFLILGTLLMHLLDSTAPAQTGRVINLGSESVGNRRGSWASSAATILEYATGHRVAPCELVTLAALQHLADTKGLRACCEINDPYSKQTCRDSGFKRYSEFASFLAEKLGVRNKTVSGAASFKEIVDSIDKDRPVLIWLEDTHKENAPAYVLLVYGYNKAERRESLYRRNENPEDLVVLNWWGAPLPDKYERHKIINVIPYSVLSRVDNKEVKQNQRLRSDDESNYYGYSDFENYRWTGTVFLLNRPSVKTPQWIKRNENEPSVENAIQVDVDDNKPIYICRAEQKIGKLVNGRCYIYSEKSLISDSEEISTLDYELLTGDQTNTSWGTFTTNNPSAFNFTNRPLVRSRHEAIMPTSFLCRALVGNRMLPGNVLGNTCLVINEGKVVEKTDFQTLNFNRPVTTELPVTALEVDLNQEITNAENRFRESIGQLLLIRGTLPDGGTLDGYNVNQVKQIIEQNKLSLSESLGKSAFSGMKAYVDRFYPLANGLVTFKIREEQALGRPDVNFYVNKISFVYQQNKDAMLATPGSVDEAIRAVYSFFDKLRANVVAIDLFVVSQPDEAGIELKTALGKIRTTSTNSTFTNVFRGLYTYTVKKNGYKNIQQELNLIDEAGTNLKCKLYPSTVKDGPYPCSLQ